jgi:hypothetical protein
MVQSAALDPVLALAPSRRLAVAVERPAHVADVPADVDVRRSDVEADRPSLGVLPHHDASLGERGSVSSATTASEGRARIRTDLGCPQIGRDS